VIAREEWSAWSPAGTTPWTAGPRAQSGLLARRRIRPRRPPTRRPRARERHIGRRPGTRADRRRHLPQPPRSRARRHRGGSRRRTGHHLARRPRRARRARRHAARLRAATDREAHQGQAPHGGQRPIPTVPASPRRRALGSPTRTARTPGAGQARAPARYQSGTRRTIRPQAAPAGSPPARLAGQRTGPGPLS
jgi:hypothetical protein